MITVWGRANSTNVIKVLWLCEELNLRFSRKDVGDHSAVCKLRNFLH